VRIHCSRCEDGFLSSGANDFVQVKSSLTFVTELMDATDTRGNLSRREAICLVGRDIRRNCVVRVLLP